MLVGNDHKKQLKKNFVIECNNEKYGESNHKNNKQNRDYTNLKKLPWIRNISPKIKHELKKIPKDIAFTSEKIYNKLSVKRINQNCYQIVNHEYTS